MLINIILPIFNDITHLDKIINILSSQNIDINHTLKVTLVDDGSSLDTQKELDSNFKKKVNYLIHLPVNQGRATACNTGAYTDDKVDILIFLDSDCIPQNNYFIQHHIETLKQADISCGKLTTTLTRHIFWDRYQQDVVLKREKDYHTGGLVAFTTANIAIKSNLFRQVNGFSTDYKHYGFEDRDFLLRCKQYDAIFSYTPTAIVSHEDKLSIGRIAIKMQQAGQFTALTFRKNHQDFYEKTMYGRIDLNLNPYIKIIWPLIKPIITIISSQQLDKLLDSGKIPYFYKKNIVHLISALNFMEGTSKQARHST